MLPLLPASPPSWRYVSHKNDKKNNTRQRPWQIKPSGVCQVIQHERDVQRTVKHKKIHTHTHRLFFTVWHERTDSTTASSPSASSSVRGVSSLGGSTGFSFAVSFARHFHAAEPAAWTSLLLPLLPSCAHLNKPLKYTSFHFLRSEGKSHNNQFQRTISCHWVPFFRSRYFLVTQPTNHFFLFMCVKMEWCGTELWEGRLEYKRRKVRRIIFPE